MANCDEIIIEYDDTSKNYCIFWRPLVAVGMGDTEKAALEDLRQAAHLGIETEVNLKLTEIDKGG